MLVSAGVWATACQIIGEVVPTVTVWEVVENGDLEKIDTDVRIHNSELQIRTIVDVDVKIALSNH